MTPEEKQIFIQQKSLDRAKIDWTLHAIQAAFDDGFQQEEIEGGLPNAAIIEDYPTRGRRLPDGLVLGFTPAGKPFHSVVAIDGDHDTIVMVTVYEPGSEAWESDLKTRKKK